MHSLYLVHGNILQRVLGWFFLMINAASIKDNLYDVINPDQLEIPPFVMEYDVQVSRFICCFSFRLFFCDGGGGGGLLFESEKSLFRNTENPNMFEFNCERSF